MKPLVLTKETLDAKQKTTNQPEINPKASLSPEGVVLGTYPPNANASQGGGVLRSNQPELNPEANLSLEGVVSMLLLFKMDSKIASAIFSPVVHSNA